MFDQLRALTTEEKEVIRQHLQDTGHDPNAWKLKDYVFGIFPLSSVPNSDTPMFGYPLPVVVLQNSYGELKLINAGIAGIQYNNRYGQSVP